MAASHKAFGRVYRFLHANKNRSEHLVKTSLSSEAPTDIKDDRSPPTTTTTNAATISFNVQKAKYALVCVITSQKQGLGEEMKPIPH